MEFYPRLYVGKKVKNPTKLKAKLAKHAKLSDAYVITLSKNQHDQLEIQKAGCLAQKYYRLNPPYVIGLATDYDEAIEIVQQIVQETYAAQGNCKLKEYLACYM